MVARKQRVVIVGAGMAGLSAANKLYTAPGSADVLELSVVEGGDRIGGRIRTSQFCGDRIEMGATWIHGIGGSPIYKIASEIGSLRSDQPWERMDGIPEEPVTVVEGGFLADPTVVDPISALYRNLMELAKGKNIAEDAAAAAAKLSCCRNGNGNGNGNGQLSIGSFLRRGLDAYWVLKGEGGDRKTPLRDCGYWSRRSLEKAVFAMHENTERTYTSAGDLLQLDFEAEKEYREFPDEEITIARGYSSIIESLASVLPAGMIQLGRKVEKIEWHPGGFSDEEGSSRPVKLHFEDGSVMAADHVIVTVSLGVLKAGIREEEAVEGGLFSPQLPPFKTDAITRLGFGVVNKLFLELDNEGGRGYSKESFPFLQMAFDQSPPSAAAKQGKIPWWMRRTVSVWPIYKNSSVLLSWFAGQEALQLECLKDKEIVEGVSTTLCHMLPDANLFKLESLYGKLGKVLKSSWGNDPLFLGSYSFVAVGSSGEDLDLMAEPLPAAAAAGPAPPLQLLFAGEATHRTHYSTTHGAYCSGIREANRLLQHYSLHFLDHP
ncbi:hypothetical protein ACLOJK_014596 [Asimina triloba]